MNSFTFPFTGERFVPDIFVSKSMEREHSSRYEMAVTTIKTQFPSASDDSYPQLFILDAPCGVGFGSRMLVDDLGSTVLGLDVDEQTITYAKVRYGIVGPKLRFAVADLDTTPLTENIYNVVVCFEGIEHVQNPEEVAKKLCDSLVPRGLIFVSTPRRGGPGAGSEFHTKEFLKDEFIALFEPHLTYYNLWGQNTFVGDCSPDEFAAYYVLVGRK